MKRRFERVMLKLGWVPAATYRQAVDDAVYFKAKARRAEAALSTSTGGMDLRLLDINRRALELVRS